MSPSIQSFVKSHRLSACALVAVAAAAFAGGAAAAIYKWVDASGRVIYSDQPPMGDVNAGTIAGSAPPSNPNAVRDMALQEAELKKRIAQREEEARKPGGAPAGDAKARQELCQRVRSEIARLQNSDQVLMYRYNEKGEAVQMDSAARRQERERLERIAADGCSGAN
jgi:hypothetical protein